MNTVYLECPSKFLINPTLSKLYILSATINENRGHQLAQQQQRSITPQAFLCPRQPAMQHRDGMVTAFSTSVFLFENGILNDRRGVAVWVNGV